MSVQALSCPKCAGPITVPPDLEHFNCAYCGVGIYVKRGDGFVALKLAEVVTSAIRESSENTQAVIREGTQQTHNEIRKVQLGQELSAAQLHLSNLQSEIRLLERTKQTGQIRKQLKNLRQQESQISQRISAIQATLYPASPHKPPPASASSGNLKSGCLMGCGTYLALTVCIVAAGMAVSPASFDGTGTPPLVTGLSVVAFLLGALVFIYYLNPDAPMWQPLKRPFARTSPVPVSDTANRHPAITEVPNPFSAKDDT